MHTTRFISRNKIRQQFTEALSLMYQEEVPLYQKFCSLVEATNKQALVNETKLSKHEAQILSVEHHGAIRVGTKEELFLVRRLFSVMGMHPVDYYDLSIAGIPVHSTAFRPLSVRELKESPFRIFCSLLRLDLVKDKSLAIRAKSILSSRKIAPDTLVSIIEKSEEQGGLEADQVSIFIYSAIEVFRWHQNSLIDKKIYEEFKEIHPLIADVVSFKGPHINHLTPKVLDIDTFQEQLSVHNIKAKNLVEGPPKRNCPILLRQTSFMALAEEVNFKDGKSGHHTARFGEVEQRGIALTPKGRKLYDRLLQQAMDGDSNVDFEARLQDAFKGFPDDYDQLRQQKLAYFHYSIDGLEQKKLEITDDFEMLIEQGLIKITPIIYEDFLPVSAAGIFKSNLIELKGNRGEQNSLTEANHSSFSEFESALGVEIINSFKKYEEIQQLSIEEVFAQLGINSSNLT